MKKILLIILGIFLFNACMTNDYYYISPTGEKSKIVKPNPPIKIEKNEYEGFANGFPEWTLEPPQIAVRRKK